MNTDLAEHIFILMFYVSFPNCNFWDHYSHTTNFIE